MPKTSTCKDDKAALFIKQVVVKIEPVLKKLNLASWQATTTGKKTWYKKYEEAELELRDIFSNKDWFKQAKIFKDSALSDPIIKRQVAQIYLDLLENQIDPKLTKEMVSRSKALEEKFNTYRAMLNGVATTDNKIKEILKKSIDPTERKEAWEASKQIGAEVANDLIALVKKRNEAARSLGFKNYYVMMLELMEQDEKDLFKLFDKLVRLTEKPYKKLKYEIDHSIAKKFKIAEKDVRPWHYEDLFFQQSPRVYNVDLNKYFKGKDILKIVKTYYSGLGMPVSDILARSDLYERGGKEQHAYCTHIDRRGDIRILANIQQDEDWTSTMLHELGHAVYEKYLDKDLPFLLREPAHIFTTEAIAELFGKQTHNPIWLANFVDPKKKSEFESISANLERLQRATMLIFARWDIVMTNFERELYSNPDQNLNKLWWNLVEKFQMVKRPEGRDKPDWAAKIHFTTSPVYYHNYLLGELFASQLTHYINKNVKDKNIGEYFKKMVFAPANKFRWDELVKYATGKELTPKYFVEEFL